jgi:FkbM family methyltransferase
MTIKHAFRLWARRAGVDIRRFNAIESTDARLVRQMEFHSVEFVLDVGANDGGYGRALRDAGYRGDILSFEPLTQAHAALQRITSGDPRWHVAARMALGAQDTEISINIAGNSVSSSILPMNHLHAQAAPQSRYQGQEPVPLRRLDGIDDPGLGRATSVMLKIDTQGYEMAVLRGAESTLPRIRGVQVELSTVALYQDQPVYDEVMTFLQSRGFVLWNVIPGFVDRQSGRMLQFDGVFYRA